MNNLVTKIGISLLERGWIPQSLAQKAVKNLCSKRLEELRTEEKETGLESTLGRFVKSAIQGPIAPVPEKANEQHYEVPAEFYLEILGPALKYSSCYFEDDNTSLADAEQLALNQTSQHAQISDGMNILELGCGWGSLTLHMAKKFPNCRITAVSNSGSQREFIRTRALEMGVADQVTLITQDMNDLALEQEFDRVVSVEMFEHMRNYEQLLENISKWLRPDGKLFVHIFCHRKYAYEFRTEGAANWMGQYFFSGGIMPSADIFDYFRKHLHVTEQWNWSGTHYQKTCAAWRHLMQSKKKTLLPILAKIYGQNQASRWFQRWNLFLMAGEELFGFENGNQWQVSHYLLENVAQSTTSTPSNSQSESA